MVVHQRNTYLSIFLWNVVGVCSVYRYVLLATWNVKRQWGNGEVGTRYHDHDRWYGNYDNGVHLQEKIKT